MKNPGLARLSLIALLALACLYTYRYEQPETRSWPAAGITRISARTANGYISIAGGTDTVITAVITRFAYGRNRTDAERAVSNVTVTDTVAGSELQLVANMPQVGARPYGAFYAIAAPESTGCALHTTNGALTVTRLRGTLDAGTTNGAISLTDTRGPATLETTNGEVLVAGHSGSVTAGTTNGLIRCDLAALEPSQAVELQTTNSGITVFLPADVSATIEAENTNGTIQFLDFSYTFDSLPTEHHVRALVGSGSSTVSLATTNGDITVRRR